MDEWSPLKRVAVPFSVGEVVTRRLSLNLLLNCGVDARLCLFTVANLIRLLLTTEVDLTLIRPLPRNMPIQ